MSQALMARALSHGQNIMPIWYDFAEHILKCVTHVDCWQFISSSMSYSNAIAFAFAILVYFKFQSSQIKKFVNMSTFFTLNGYDNTHRAMIPNSSKYHLISENLLEIINSWKKFQRTYVQLFKQQCTASLHRRQVILKGLSGNIFVMICWVTHISPPPLCNTCGHCTC